MVRELRRRGDARRESEPFCLPSTTVITATSCGSSRFSGVLAELRMAPGPNPLADQAMRTWQPRRPFLCLRKAPSAIEAAALEWGLLASLVAWAARIGSIDPTSQKHSDGARMAL